MFKGRRLACRSPAARRWQAGSAHSGQPEGRGEGFRPPWHTARVHSGQQREGSEVNSPPYSRLRVASSSRPCAPVCSRCQPIERASGGKREDRGEAAPRRRARRRSKGRGAIYRACKPQRGLHTGCRWGARMLGQVWRERLHRFAYRRAVCSRMLGQVWRGRLHRSAYRRAVCSLARALAPRRRACRGQYPPVAGCRRGGREFC